jgi:hypothetical protein
LIWSTTKAARVGQKTPLHEMREKAYGPKWGRRTWAVLFTIIVVGIVSIAIGEFSGRRDDVTGTV